jgi:AraC family transcriptional regulator, transcriptional activator of pobA
MNSVIIEDNTSNLSAKEYEGYQAFIYCYKGSCILSYNEGKHEMCSDSCAIILNSKFLKGVKPTPDFECEVIYIEESFLRQSEPRNPYIIQGMLSLYTLPVMTLNEQEATLCKALFKNFNIRLGNTQHKFYEDILRTSVHMLLLDLYDFHARIHESDNTSISAASIMAKFINMLEAKEYRNNREVAYYAEKLCVVPKYLSEVSNKVSGFSASYWINRYASQDINEALRKNEYPVADIAQMFHFTSTSYFNRYVKRNLGSYPSELRGQ